MSSAFSSSEGRESSSPLSPQKKVSVTGCHVYDPNFASANAAA